VLKLTSAGSKSSEKLHSTEFRLDESEKNKLYFNILRKAFVPKLVSAGSK
jgi:hypothetical protein